MKSSDLGFVIETWLKNYRSSRFAEPMSGPIYHGEMRKVIMRVLEVSTVTVACPPDDEDQIFGSVVYRVEGDRNILSWIYVKPVFRHMGVGHRLLECMGRPTHCTCIARSFQSMRGQVNEWLRHIEYNPFLDLTLGAPAIKDRRE